MSRRQLLLGMAAGTAVVALGTGFGSGFAATTATQPSSGLPLDEGRIKRAVTAIVKPFSLFDVRLLDSPFLQAQQRDAKYLLQLEPDRLLHNFRVNAGLAPKAPVYGGWESVQTWADIRCHGHTLGHYASACAMMYASTGEAQYKERCDHIRRTIAGMPDCGENRPGLCLSRWSGTVRQHGRGPQVRWRAVVYDAQDFCRVARHPSLLQQPAGIGCGHQAVRLGTGHHRKPDRSAVSEDAQHRAWGHE